jgi:hypothetical protein
MRRLTQTVVIVSFALQQRVCFYNMKCIPPAIVSRLFITLGLIMGAGCVPGLPQAHPPYPNRPYEEAGMPDFAGRDFCRAVERLARKNSVAHRWWGWIAGVGALGTAATGAGVAASDQPNDGGGKNRYKVAVVTLPLVAGMLAYGAQGQFGMADNSAGVASTAATASSFGDDREANTTCNAAIATWNSDNTTATAAFSAAVTQLSHAKKETDKAAELPGEPAAGEEKGGEPPAPETEHE